MKRLDDPGALLAGLPAGSTVVMHSACAEPQRLAREVAANAARMHGANLVTLMPMG